MAPPEPSADPRLDSLILQLHPLLDRTPLRPKDAADLLPSLGQLLHDAHAAGVQYERRRIGAVLFDSDAAYISHLPAVPQQALADAVRAHREAFVRFQRTTSHSEDLMVAVREVDATRNAMFALVVGNTAQTPGNDSAAVVLRTLRDAARAVVAAQAAGYRPTILRAAIDAMARLLPPKDPTP